MARVARHLGSAALLAVCVAAPAHAATQVSEGGGDTSAFARPVSVETAASAGRQIVVWSAPTGEHGFHQVWARLLGPDGAAIGSPFQVSSTSVDGQLAEVRTVAAAARGAGDEFLVVWSQLRREPYSLYGSGPEIAARRVGGDGALGEQFVIADPEGSRYVGVPSVAHGSRDDEFLVVWQAVGGLYGDANVQVEGARVPGGEAVASAVFTISDSSSAVTPAIAYDSRRHRYLVVWDADDWAIEGGQRGLYGRLVSAPPSGRLGRERLLSRGRPPSDEPMLPSVAYGRAARAFLASWTDGAGEDTRVSARRIGADGRPAGAEVQVSSPRLWAASGAAVQAAPAGGFLVVYDGDDHADRGRGDGVFARRFTVGFKVRPQRRVSTAGETADTASATYSPAESGFKAAWAEGPGDPPAFAVFTGWLAAPRP
jgi:hypothetical protein